MEAELLPADIIRALPQNIIETILCLLPIQEAARTCVLSREWRYTWTKIPKLVFNEDTFENQVSEGEMIGKRCRVFYSICLVLLMHRGPLHEFTLSMKADNSCVEIDRIIYHLSRYNTLKKFKFDARSRCAYRVPFSILLMHQLTDLYLRKCCLDHLPTSNGFVNLTSLHLEDVDTTTQTVLHLLSKSLQLKSFTLIIRDYKLMKHGVDGPTISDIFECLPVIEYLTINIFGIQFLAAGRAVPQEHPTSLVNLKYLCLKDMCMGYPYGLPFFVHLIKRSPNLEKIKLEMFPGVGELSEYDYYTPWLRHLEMEKYFGICLEHLKELEIEDFSYLKPDLEFVKLILAKAPVLRKVKISLCDKVATHEELKLLRILLRSPRASPVVEIIIVEHPANNVRSSV